jgi:hypothetical protein
MEGLTEGRIVHYVIPEDGRNAGEHRAAMVVRVWQNGVCNLHVFWDGDNDGAVVPNWWITSVHYDETGTQGRTWHWIERA